MKGRELEYITGTCVSLTIYARFFSAAAGGGVGISGYSNFTPGSHSKTGQQCGNGAVLLVFSESLHFGLVFGNGPQSSTNSSRRPSSSAFTQVDLPQNGLNSHEAPGAMVAHLVEAKHMFGKSVTKEATHFSF